MTVAMIPVILFLLPVVVSLSVSLDGNCSMTRPKPQRMRVWGIQRDSLTCNLLPTSSCEHGLPDAFGGSFMGSPDTLCVDGILIPDPVGGLSPQIVIQWKPPRTGTGFENLKGFFMEIERIPLTGATPAMPFYFCRIFDMTNNQFTAVDYKLNFEKRFVGIAGGNHNLYLIRMYTLPMTNASIPKKAFFTLQPVQNSGQPVPADWSAGISYGDMKLTSSATITFRFTLAPKEFRFKKYNVMLIRQHVDDKNAVISCKVDINNDYPCQGKYNSHPSENATAVEHSFLNISAGTYRVWVQAFDPNWQDDKKCLCYKSIKGNVRDCSQHCITSQTGDIVVS